MGIIVLPRVLRDLEGDAGIVEEFAHGGREALEFEELLCIVAQGAVELPRPGQVAEGDGGGSCHVDYGMAILIESRQFWMEREVVMEEM